MNAQSGLFHGPPLKPRVRIGRFIVFVAVFSIALALFVWKLGFLATSELEHREAILLLLGLAGFGEWGLIGCLGLHLVDQSFHREVEIQKHAIPWITILLVILYVACMTGLYFVIEFLLWFAYLVLIPS